jgi:hypothetical protein
MWKHRTEIRWRARIKWNNNVWEILEGREEKRGGQNFYS